MDAATPSTERIRELSERLDSLRGELASERIKTKASPPSPNFRWMLRCKQPLMIEN